MTKASFDVVVIGAGPAGTAAAVRAAELGAKTALITRGAFGGMAANEGPIPVRTLAHAARLLREARQLPRYGIVVGAPKVDYPGLVARAAEVVAEARLHSTLLGQVTKAGVSLYEDAGFVGFVDPATIRSEREHELRSEKFVLCTGGVSRPLSIPGEELAVTPAAAFSLHEVPESMIVIGAGATGAQVASIFNALGCSIALCQAGPRIIATEDEDVSREVAAAFRDDGIEVIENFGRVRRLERVAGGVRVVVEGGSFRVAELVVSAIGWTAETGRMNLQAAGVAVDRRGFVEVDASLATSAPNIYAAGDVLGRSMLVPQAVRDGFIAGTNAATGKALRVPDDVEPIGSFTDPEYAKVGMTEEEARKEHRVLISRASYAETTRPVIDGRTRGFCKLVVDRDDLRILGCHIVGERAVEVSQMAAVAMTAAMKVTDLARIPLAFPTYGNVLGRAAIRAARELGETMLGEP